MKVKTAYIAGPYTAKTRDQVNANIAVAKHVGKLVASCGIMPFIPHCNTDGDFLDVKLPEGINAVDFWYQGTAAMLMGADAIVLINGWMESKGSKAEHEMAISMGKKIFDLESDDFSFRMLEEWAKE